MHANIDTHGEILVWFSLLILPPPLKTLEWECGSLSYVVISGNTVLTTLWALSHFKCYLKANQVSNKQVPNSVPHNLSKESRDLIQSSILVFHGLSLKSQFISF